MTMTNEQVRTLPGELLRAAIWLETIDDPDAYPAGWAAIKRAIALATEVLAYRTALSAVMPLDFKDWHENAREEWPEVAAAVITSLRAREDLAYRELDAQRARTCGTCAEYNGHQCAALSDDKDYFTPPPTWHCADWRAKAPATHQRVGPTHTPYTTEEEP